MLLNCPPARVLVLVFMMVVLRWVRVPQSAQIQPPALIFVLVFMVVSNGRVGSDVADLAAGADFGLGLHDPQVPARATVSKLRVDFPRRPALHFRDPLLPSATADSVEVDRSGISPIHLDCAGAGEIGVGVEIADPLHTASIV